MNSQDFCHGLMHLSPVVFHVSLSTIPLTGDVDFTVSTLRVQLYEVYEGKESHH